MTGQGVVVLNWKGQAEIGCEKRSFTERVIKQWNRFPKKAEDSPALKVFNPRQDGAWSSVIL